MRSGVIAKKIGMSSYHVEGGGKVPVSLLEVDCQVVSVKKVENDGYNSVQVGAGDAKNKRVSKALKGHFAKNKVPLKKKLAEFRVSEDALLAAGSKFSVSHYVPGQFIDVSGYSKGKGFAGGMKRHGFGGLEATHGVSISHRSHGSTGQCQDPGKVFKGKKMAGQYGDKKTTVQNLEIMDVDLELGIIVVSGAVPGSKGSYVLVSDAVKRARPNEAPFPAGLLDEKKEEKPTKTEKEVGSEQKISEDQGVLADNEVISTKADTQKNDKAEGVSFENENGGKKDGKKENEQVKSDES